MYPAEYYLEHDRQKIFRVVETYSFATVISRTEDDVVVTHLPLILDRQRGEFGYFDCCVKLSVPVCNPDQTEHIGDNRYKRRLEGKSKPKWHYAMELNYLKYLKESFKWLHTLVLRRPGTPWKNWLK